MIFLLLLCLAFLLLKIQDEVNLSVVDEALPAACPACEKEVSLDWMVCPHCLKRLRESCPSCQQRKSIIHRFCTSCGADEVAG